MEKSSRKRLEGIVASNKADKTVVVSVERLKSHKKYRKKVIVAKRIMAHDAENKCKAGDKIEIEESAPISKNKKWVVSKIIKASQI